MHAKASNFCVVHRWLVADEMRIGKPAVLEARIQFSEFAYGITISMEIVSFGQL